jgi:hypothetical protein
LIKILLIINNLINIITIKIIALLPKNITLILLIIITPISLIAPKIKIKILIILHILSQKHKILSKAKKWQIIVINRYEIKKEIKIRIRINTKIKIKINQMNEIS